MVEVIIPMAALTRGAGVLRFLFEDYELDTARRELRRAGSLVPLEPQVFDLLAYLVRHRDRVVTKEDLFAAVWNGRFISESALTTRINAARVALGDSGAAQRAIRTLRGRGYRFAGDVRQEGMKPASTDISTDQQETHSLEYMPVGASGMLRTVLAICAVKHAQIDLVKNAIGSLGAGQVTTLGSGINQRLLVEFPDARSATQAIFDLRRQTFFQTTAVQQLKQLRIGAHSFYDERARVAAGEVASGLANLARPGEMLASDELFDQLTDGLDVHIEDCGPRTISALSAPLRVYRISEQQPTAMPSDHDFGVQMRPVIAVIPFDARSPERGQEVLGEVLAEDVIAALSSCAELGVISRLSTRSFRGRRVELKQISTHLRANYALSGSYDVSGDTLKLRAELAEIATGTVLWSRELKGKINEITSGSSDMLRGLVADTSASIAVHAFGRTQNQPLQTLDNYVILFSAINMLHRVSPSSFNRSREMLEELISRAPFNPIPLAWLSRWYILRLNQGWSNDPAAEGQTALDCCQRALDADPGCALALAVDGFAQLHFRKRFDIASDRLNLALEANPNESVAWLWKGVLHTFSGEGERAVAAAERALRLSPLDPRRGHYEAIAAAAAMEAGQHDRAIELAQRALRVNGGHASALRTLAASQVWSGRLDEARETVTALLRIEPALTVSQYLHRHPAGELATGRRLAEALCLAGLPE